MSKSGFSLDSRPSTIRDQITESFELLPQSADCGRQKRLNTPTGFVNIDEHTHGLWPGELPIVTGGPGVGKSSFAANLALNAAKLGARVLLVALGTSSTETVIRMCAAGARVKVADALDGEGDWSALADSSNRLAELDMHICDDSRTTFDGLASMVRHAVGDEKKALVVIDGIELMTLPDGDHVFDWPHMVGNAATFPKKLAREIDAPILATMDYGVGGRSSDIRSYGDVLRALRRAGRRDERGPNMVSCSARDSFVPPGVLFTEERRPMDLIPKEQFDDLESHVMTCLEELFEEQMGRPLWEAVNSDGQQGYPSEMMFLCNTWTAMNEWLDEHGVSDGFTLERSASKGYPPPAAYNEEKARALGQLIGDVIVAVNPAGYADATPDQPFVDVRGKFGPDHPFVFEPLPMPDKWEAVGADELHREPTGSAVTRAKRFTFRSDLWFELWEEDWAEKPGESVREGGEPSTTWIAQLCAPCEAATMHDTTMSRWIALDYLERYDEYRHFDDYNHVYRFRPAWDEHQAWAIAADFWQGIAYRYL